MTKPIKMGRIIERFRESWLMLTDVRRGSRMATRNRTVNEPRPNVGFSNIAPDFPPRSVTYLGDDLYANQPLCELIDQTYQQYFIFVCKADSHPTLYQEVALLEKTEGVTTHQVRRWNGRHHEPCTYRHASRVPLRSGDDALYVNWCELHITHAKTDDSIYHNAWVTNHSLSVHNAAEVSSMGRTRWKVENENIIDGLEIQHPLP